MFIWRTTRSHQDAGLAQNFAGERQQGNVARSLDGLGEGALVPGAGARLAPGADFAVIGYEPAQYFHLFIVDGGIFVHAELAFARAGEKTPAASLLLTTCGLVAHFTYSLPAGLPAGEISLQENKPSSLSSSLSNSEVTLLSRRSSSMIISLATISVA